jgi:hypothetical protein
MSHADLREFLRDAAQLGFVAVGRDGAGHVRLHNPDTGHRYSAAYTPSDWRSHRNAIATLERLSGRKLPRQRNGKHRHRKVSQLLDTTLSPAERRASDQVAALLEEADSVHRRIKYLADEQTRNAAGEMRRALAKYGHLRDRLEALHHSIPPVNIPV